MVRKTNSGQVLVEAIFGTILLLMIISVCLQLQQSYESHKDQNRFNSFKKGRFYEKYKTKNTTDPKLVPG